MKRLTWHKKKEKYGKATDRSGTRWKEEIAEKCEHNWQPISFVFEAGKMMPDIDEGKVYCVCMKCRSHTYVVTGYIGYYLGSPDCLEEE